MENKRNQKTILDFIESNLETSQIVSVWNDYCFATGRDGFCYDNDDETLAKLYSKNITDLLVGIQGGDYSVSSRYFWVDNMDRVYSFSNAHGTNSPVNVVELSGWLAENDTNFNTLVEYASVPDELIGTRTSTL